MEAGTCCPDGEIVVEKSPSDHDGQRQVACYDRTCVGEGRLVDCAQTQARGEIRDGLTNAGKLEQVFHEIFWANNLQWLKLKIFEMPAQI